MITSSPLRYPGGKGAMWPLLQEIRRLNGLGDRAIAEPFAGGAGASLSLLFMEEAPEILINDADDSLHDFWWAVTHRATQFLKLLDSTRVSVTEWRRQRDTYKRSTLSRLRRGFAAFYLNRCNRSGIIRNGSVIGGLLQEGPWKIDARFNKSDLRRRIERVNEFRDRIHVFGDDGIRFIRKFDKPAVFLFIDPPYYHKGKTLYLNALETKYHERLAKALQRLKRAAWVLTYDDCPEVRALYESWTTIRPFSLRYSAADRRSGREVMIVPRGMHLPSWQQSASIDW